MLRDAMYVQRKKFKQTLGHLIWNSFLNKNKTVNFVLGRKLQQHFHPPYKQEKM